ncbi:MAG: hypothetical protein JNK48_24695 [Bryobacterales bacterium]|nr:hypothetical protein [Bryobacterales bacterium]
MLKKVLATLLACALVLPAQQATNLVAQSSGGLKIVVIQGEGATNNVRSRTATSPVVEVRDAGDKPVAGAEVTFQLPVSGAGGYFNGWLRNQTVRTDANGRAASTGMTPNDEQGRFNIKVTAVEGSRNGSIVIAQSNVAGSSSSASSSGRKSNWWKWAAVLGGAAIAGGVVAGTRGDDTTTAASGPRVVTVNPGVITVGGPR